MRSNSPLILIGDWFGIPRRLRVSTMREDSRKSLRTMSGKRCFRLARLKYRKADRMGARSGCEGDVVMFHVEMSNIAQPNPNARNSVPGMNCAVMVQLIQKLDTVRAEQISPPRDIDDPAKKRRLRAIEKFLDLHQRTCVKCGRINQLAQN